MARGGPGTRDGSVRLQQHAEDAAHGGPHSCVVGGGGDYTCVRRMRPAVARDMVASGVRWHCASEQRSGKSTLANVQGTHTNPSSLTNTISVQPVPCGADLPINISAPHGPGPAEPIQAAKRAPSSIHWLDGGVAGVGWPG